MKKTITAFLLLSCFNGNVFSVNLETDIKAIVAHAQSLETTKTNKEHLIQPIICLILNQQDNKFKEWLKDEDHNNSSKFIKHYNHYDDISRNIDTIAFLKLIAQQYNKNVLEVIEERYEECYQQEEKSYSLIQQIVNNNFKQQYTLPESHRTESFKKYVQSLMQDIGE